MNYTLIRILKLMAMHNGNTRSLRYDQTKTALAVFGRQVALATHSNHVLVSKLNITYIQAKMCLIKCEVKSIGLFF